MDRRALYAAALLVFPVGSVGAATTLYAHTAFATLNALDATSAQAEAPEIRPPQEPALPTVPKQAPRIGDSALAPADSARRLYPAVVIGEPSVGRVEIAFENRDRATVPIEALRPIPDRHSVRASVRSDGRWSSPDYLSPWQAVAAYPDVALSELRFEPTDAPEGELTRSELDTWARYRGRGPAYPATIVAELSTHVALVYADGDHELVEHEALLASPPAPGARMEARLPGSEEWTEATLVSLSGRAVQVRTQAGVLWLPAASVRLSEEGAP